MSEFDAELDRRIADLKSLRDRPEPVELNHAPASEADAQSVADELSAALGSQRLRFRVAAPGEVMEDGDEDEPLVADTSARTAIWYGDQDVPLGYVRIAGLARAFEPNWENVAALYFDDVEAPDPQAFAASLREELLSGLASFFAEGGDD